MPLLLTEQQDYLLSPISNSETEQTIKHLKSRRAAGPDDLQDSVVDSNNKHSFTPYETSGQ